MKFNGRLNAAVESDVVGYTTITMEAGKWYQVGTPFVNLDESAQPKINTVFTSGFGAGDTLSVYNPATSLYTTYHWNTNNSAWCASKRPTAAAVDVILPTGKAVFINKAVAGEVTLSGKVSFAEATEFGSATGNAWDQIVCVYPETIKLNEIIWTGLASGDTLSIYDTETALYTTYHWNTTKSAWCASKRPTAAAVDVNVPAGQALFINKASVGTASCQAPNN